ncbi:hypothetical protein [Patulibacter defluvii]|uniref:hypothetical protein n=1 Tax=Patulibacter defluvii TaxID=3095358 RepID=UPI002A763046|nr:hypothetical protein [Patulibacter sp. DM4]
MKFKIRRSVAIPTAAAVITAAVVGTAGVIGNDDAPDRGPAAVALSAGAPASADQIQRLRAVPESVAYKPTFDDARSVPNPTGKGADWVVVPAGDGGACLAAPEGITCGDGHDIKTGRFGFTATDVGDLTADQLAANREALADEKPVPFNAGTIGGLTEKFGLAPDGVTEVVSIDAGGGETGRAKVQNGVYKISVGKVDGRSGARKLRLLTSTGEVAAEVELQVL